MTSTLTKRLAALLAAPTLVLSAGVPAHALQPDDRPSGPDLTPSEAVVDAGVARPDGSVVVRDGGFEVDGLRVTIVGEDRSPDHLSGRAVWAGTDAAVDHVVQANADSVQALSVFRDASTSTVAYRFDGAELTRNDDGSVTVWPAGGVESAPAIGVIAAPWAKDAAGASVATRYRVQGDTLVQEVDLTEQTRFPVVADPRVVRKWYGSQIRFSSYETRYISYGARSCAIMAAAIPDPVASKIVAAGCAAMSLAADVARSRGKCLAANVFYTGHITPWYWNC